MSITVLQQKQHSGIFQLIVKLMWFKKKKKENSKKDCTANTMQIYSLDFNHELNIHLQRPWVSHFISWCINFPKSNT